MPTRKEWIVDEKGFHAKSVWEPAPSDKTAVDVSEIEAPAKQETSPYAKIVLQDVELVHGPDGFAFNKKCTARATVDVKDKTVNKRITFRLSCKYNGTDYEIKPSVEGVIHDNIAEAEMTLYYGEKEDGCTYYEDSLKDPSITCEYIVRVSHPATSEIKESKPITMPQQESDKKLYGGYELKKGDNDNKKIRGGEKKDEEGAYVAELQKDLFSLGYWITDGLTIQDPMAYDGDLGHGTYSGLKTFQCEHKDSKKLKVSGALDSETAKAIKECIQNSSFKRPGVSVSLSNTTKFYQLPPSKNYKRYNAASPDYTIKKRSDGSKITGDLEDVYHNHLWGTKEVIEALEKIADKWTKEIDYDSETDMIEVGDISAWCGGDTRHSTHKDGQGMDIRANSVGVLDRKEYKFDKDKSVKFAKLAKEKGFGRIITLCPHISEECNSDKKKYVTLIKYHEHHFHLDFNNSGNTVSDSHIERAYCKKCKWEDSCNSEHKESD